MGKLTESRAKSRAIELASIVDGENILEVAVGTGLAFCEIVKRNAQGNNVGVDLSKGILEKAKYMFDLISFEDIDKVVLEFKRVLKAGAKLVLVDMAVGETWGGRFYEFIYRVSPKIMGGCRGVETR